MRNVDRCEVTLDLCVCMCVCSVYACTYEHRQHAGLNTINDMVTRSVRSNFMSIPTDCPTRERAGWSNPNRNSKTVTVTVNPNRNSKTVTVTLDPKPKPNPNPNSHSNPNPNP